MRVKCLAQEYNTMSAARARTLAPESSAITMRPPRLPLGGKMRWNYLTQELHLNAIVYVASSFKLTAGSLAVKHRRSFAHRNYLRSNLGIISALRINEY